MKAHMLTVTCSFRFDYAHRLPNHKGKCRYLHGHRGVADVTIASPNGCLTKDGMVMDFGDIKNIVGNIIMDNWDHNILLWKDDPILLTLAAIADANSQSDMSTALFPGKRPFIFVDGPPTAEMMAKTLAEQTIMSFKAYDLDCTVAQIRINETPENCATWINAALFS